MASSPRSPLAAPLRVLGSLLTLLLLVQTAPAEPHALHASCCPAAAAQQDGQTRETSSDDSSPATGNSTAQGLTREEMWRAPTAEDWARPCLVEFERTFEDAVAVSRETGKPVLLCVNMDGEIASEHYAGIRYRQPDVAKLYEPYVCVMASVYRHNPRDFDDEGRRILCPRFGSVTCGEHIWVEPGLHDKYFEGTRVAPRHIMLELDGSETYDIFYAFDTASVFEQIQSGIANRPPVPQAIENDLTLEERVESSANSDQAIVEQAYSSGDRATRKMLLERSIQRGGRASVGLLRLGVYDLDTEMNKLARQALASATHESAIDLIADALRIPLDAEERELLVQALERLGKQYPKARQLAAVQRGLGRHSETLDVAGWSGATREEPVREEASALESRVDYSFEAARARPDDPEAYLELAEANMALAVEPSSAMNLMSDRRATSKYSRLLFEDVQRSVERAESLGARGWRVDAAAAVSCYYLGEPGRAYERAAAAVTDMPPGITDWQAMAALAIFAEGRKRAIYRAVRQSEDWPQEWLSDVHAAYSVLAKHPLGREDHAVAHHDFLLRMQARGRAKRALDEGLVRFPESWALHDRLRSNILATRGVRGLESTYEEMLQAENAAPNLSWYAGYTSIVAAEFHRRANDAADAVAAYDRAVAHYDRAIERSPECEATADHYAAIALGGRARLSLDRQDYEQCLADILASIARKPEAAAVLDGINLSTVATATTLKARLIELNRTDLVEQLQAALDTLDPEQLELPAFERPAPAQGQDRGQRGNRRRNRR